MTRVIFLMKKLRLIVFDSFLPVFRFFDVELDLEKILDLVMTSTYFFDDYVGVLIFFHVFISFYS